MNPPFPTHRIFIVTATVFLSLGVCASPIFGAPTTTSLDVPALNRALIDAAAQGNVEAVTLNVFRGANVNAVDRFRRTPLTACAAGEGPEGPRLRITKMLVGLGADVNQHSVFQPTPLLAAIDYRQEEIAKYLLDNGADPAGFDSLGDCALTHAARTGQLDLVIELIDKGADVRSTDHNGRTPLMWSSGKPARALDPTMLDEVMPSENGYTVLQYIHGRHAEASGGADIVRALIEAHAAVDAVDNDGNTALMIAASEGKTEVVRALIDAHADWKRRNDFSNNALMCAEISGYKDTIAYLKSVGGAKDPAYKALEKRLESTRQIREKEMRDLRGRQAVASKSDVPGLTLKAYADTEYITEDHLPTFHYVLENYSAAPIRVISAANSGTSYPSAVKGAWSMIAENEKDAHPEPPPFTISRPSGETVEVLAHIDVITIPANGRVDLTVNPGLSPLPDGTSSMPATGVYKAAFYYVNDPTNLPYSTDEVHALANTTTPCHLVSNEITIVNE